MDQYLYRLEEIPLSRPGGRGMVVSFLKRHGLDYDEMLEKYYGVFSGDELIGGIGYSGKVLKCAAVDMNFRGEGILNALVSRAMTELNRKGVPNIFVFTKPENSTFFSDLGFGRIEETPDVLLLESARGAFERYQNNLTAMRGEGVTGAIVMNGNPFTLGHRYLVETASKQCDRLIVFVVEEDVSIFPFPIRYRLIREGVADLANVTVVPGGDYMVSAATFPTYFLKNPSIAAHAHTILDVTIFGKRLAPAAGITRRFVGSEPGDQLTAMYNQTMMELLPAFGVEMIVIPRKERDGSHISASKVRNLLAESNPEQAFRLIPNGTVMFLQSPEAKPIIEALKRQQRRTDAP